MSEIKENWENRYQKRETPWDSKLVSQELMQVVAEISICSGRAVELGCGTGTNAIWLAQQGFQVTGVDISSTALEEARIKAQQANVSVDFVESDVLNYGEGQLAASFLFDRGCYHCCRREDWQGYLSTLQNLSNEETCILILAGNAYQQAEFGPPRVTVQQVGEEIGQYFRLSRIREFHFQDAGGAQGPLGWSILAKGKLG